MGVLAQLSVGVLHVPGRHALVTELPEWRAVLPVRLAVPYCMLLSECALFSWPSSPADGAYSMLCLASSRYDATAGAPQPHEGEGPDTGMGWGIDPMVFGAGNRSVICREPTWEEFSNAFEGTLFL